MQGLKKIKISFLYEYNKKNFFLNDNLSWKIRKISQIINKNSKNHLLTWNKRQFHSSRNFFCKTFK
jgi:hypothetical protein